MLGPEGDSRKPNEIFHLSPSVAHSSSLLLLSCRSVPPRRAGRATFAGRRAPAPNQSQIHSSHSHSKARADTPIAVAFPMQMVSTFALTDVLHENFKIQGTSTSPEDEGGRFDCAVAVAGVMFSTFST